MVLGWGEEGLLFTGCALDSNFIKGLKKRKSLLCLKYAGEVDRRHTSASILPEEVYWR